MHDVVGKCLPVFNWNVWNLVMVRTNILDEMTADV